MIRTLVSAALYALAAHHVDAQQPAELQSTESASAIRVAIDRYTPLPVAQKLYVQLQTLTDLWRIASRDTVPCVGGKCFVLAFDKWHSIGSPGPGAGRLHIAPYVVEVRQPLRHEYSILPEQRARGAVGFERRIGWVPEAMAIGGRDSIDSWISRARTDSMYACSDSNVCHAIRFGAPSGRAVVSSDASLGAALERTRTVIVADTVFIGGGSIALTDTLRDREARISGVVDTMLVDCRVQRVGLSAGPPTACVHIATLAAGERWIRVTIGTIGNGNVERVVARFDTVVNHPALSVSTPGVPMDLDGLRVAVATAFGTRPLALQTQIHSQRVLGVGSYRTSEVIPKPPPWREIVDVDVELDADRKTNDVNFFVQIHADVNPQNTPDGYGRTTGAQSKAYEAAVTDALKHAVSDVCARGVWRDSWTFRCFSTAR